MANNNYRTESQRFFNAQTGFNHRSWAKAASAYYRQVGSTDKRNFVDAMAAYFAKINAGTIAAPITLSATQSVVSDAGTLPIQNSAGAAIGTGTATVAGGNVSYLRLPATVGAVSNGNSRGVTVTTTTARTAGQSDSKTVTFTVANGVITAITIP